MADDAQKLRDKAEEKFKKAEAGKRAMAEYEAEGIARRAKTEKLRKLRLAKEASEKAEEQPKPASRRKPSRKPK